MVTIDTFGGGNIAPRGLEEEMRSAYSPMRCQSSSSAHCPTSATV
jgi:hypothetical protein